MKNIFCTALFLLLISPLVAQSDLCADSYMPFHQGTTFELTNYNHKGKVTSSVHHAIERVIETSDGYQATIETKLFDDKGKSVLDGSYMITCDENGIVLDVSSLLNSQALAAVRSMDVAVTGEGLSIPNTLRNGQTLPNAELHLQASMNGISLIKMHMQISGRSVVANETVTTPAGRFECVKIVQTTSIDGLGKSSYDSATWYARSVGMVRTENYDKKGAVDSYTELTRLHQ